MLEAPFEGTVELGAAHLSRRFDPNNPDWALLDKLLADERPIPRELGLRWLRLTAGLFLQSGSFFMPRHDHMEKGFPRYGRIVRFVRGVLRDEMRAFEHPVPATLTVGADEDNLHNNRRVAAALRLQGYPAELHEAPGGHDYGTWTAAIDAHLPARLAAAWTEA